MKAITKVPIKHKTTHQAAAVEHSHAASVGSPARTHTQSHTRTDTYGQPDAYNPQFCILCPLLVLCGVSPVHSNLLSFVYFVHSTIFSL